MCNQDSRILISRDSGPGDESAFAKPVGIVTGKSVANLEKCSPRAEIEKLFPQMAEIPVPPIAHTHSGQDCKSWVIVEIDAGVAMSEAVLK
jgi:hypothetical protein